MNYPQIFNHFELLLIGKMCLAIVLGAIIGIQRETRGRSAGLRTYALVCAGSTLFTILSTNAFVGYGNDISRIASQIVVGIGFIGAGSIIHKDNRIEGLTTAAGMWMVAAIGMAIGVSYYILAITATILTLLVLIIDDTKIVHRPDMPSENK